MDLETDSERVNLLLGSWQGYLNVNLDKEENTYTLNKTKDENIDTNNIY